jgi:hypothetical protein
MSLLHSLLLIGLLHLLPDVQAFTVELTQADISGQEGDNVDITVRLVGQIFGKVEVELFPFTVDQFRNQSEYPSGFTVNDEAELSDFIHDGNLRHNFSSVTSVHQMTIFNIDIINDDINEGVEQFVVVVRVCYIEKENDDMYVAGESERLFSMVTIRIDPNNPDKTRLAVSAPTGGSTTVSEGTTGWALSLSIESFHPEHDIEISVTAQGTSNTPASPSSDYTLTVTSVTLTSSMTSYSVPVQFEDDNIPEPESEKVAVTFRVVNGDDTVEFRPGASITITIEDNDELLIGFSVPQLTIREGHSDTVEVGIISPEMVAVSVSGDVSRSRRGTANEDEIPDPIDFSLSAGNKMKEFEIKIPDNNELSGSGERYFSLEIRVTSYSSALFSIEPRILDILIIDNDTNVEFGIRDVGESEEIFVREGEAFSFTVGFLEDYELDSEFVLGYSVKLIDASGSDLETTEVEDGILDSSIRSREITIETKPNEEVEEDRRFVIAIEHTTNFNPELVKLRAAAGSLVVVIEDDDIFPPNKPNATVKSLSSGKDFEVSWTISISPLQPIDSYRIEITFPEHDSATLFVKEIEPNSKSTFQTVTYTQNGVDYSTANISIVVCALNQKGEMCSDTVYHRGVEIGKGSTDEEGGLSSGGTAAIIIVLFVFLLLLIFLLVLLFFFCRSYFWRTYYPVIREKKHAVEFVEARNTNIYEEDV